MRIYRNMIAGGMALAALAFATPAAAKNSGTWTIKAGPIWNQADAERKCAQAARAQGVRWTGQWWTTKPGKQSVCQVRAKAKGTRTIEVGPIWNQADAEMKCRKAARRYDARWTGQWWTTVEGQMSVCELRRS